jgi:NADPH-dependent ferric siderophore reductase
MQDATWLARIEALTMQDVRRAKNKAARMRLANDRSGLPTIDYILNQVDDNRSLDMAKAFLRTLDPTPLSPL